MNEPKKRGRKSNAEKAAMAASVRVDLTEEAMSGIGAEDFDRRPFVSGKAKFATFNAPAGSGKPIEPSASIQVCRDPFDVRLAQAYALRVWNGQSPDVPRNERLRRVAKALEGQGMSMEGVEL